MRIVWSFDSRRSFAEQFRGAIAAIEEFRLINTDGAASCRFATRVLSSTRAIH